MSEYQVPSKHTDCIFCAIAEGRMKTPGVFWEDDSHMAFLSIDPNTPGFSVVIPKQHYPSDVLKMPDTDLASFVIAAKKVAHILEAHYPDVGRVGLMMEGTGVNHAHIKLAPFHQTDYLKDGGWKQVFVNQTFWFDHYEGWMSSSAGPTANPDDLAKLALDLKTTARIIS